MGTALIMVFVASLNAASVEPGPSTPADGQSAQVVEPVIALESWLGRSLDSATITVSNPTDHACYRCATEADSHPQSLRACLAQYVEPPEQCRFVVPSACSGPGPSIELCFEDGVSFTLQPSASKLWVRGSSGHPYVSFVSLARCLEASPLKAPDPASMSWSVDD